MQTLDKHFREITAKVFARHGAAAAELMIRWPEIVGAEIAALAEPVKIAWPRSPKDDTRKSGGTLHLDAAPGRALEVQHLSPQLAQRINAYFGYGAVAAVKLAGTLKPRKATEPPPPDDPAAVESIAARLATVGDEALRAALLRLGTGVLKSAADRQGNAWKSPKTSIRETP